jgi:hypothetical protein
MAVDLAGNALTYTNGTWSSPQSIDSNNDLSSVSCPLTSFCMAVDNNGNALTYSGGTWSSPQNIDSYDFRSVSCPSSSFCVAVGGGYFIGRQD